MNTIKSLAIALAIAATTAFSGATLADSKDHDHGKTDAMKSMPVADADMTNAEVRKVDKDAKKITLRHDAIKNLDMPGMTMVFQVKDAALLDKAQAGDKIKFKAIKDGSAYVVTEIQPNK